MALRLGALRATIVRNSIAWVTLLRNISAHGVMLAPMSGTEIDETFVRNSLAQQYYAGTPQQESMRATILRATMLREHV